MEREAALLNQQCILARFGELALKSSSLDEILHEACRLVGSALNTDLAKVMELQSDGITLLVKAGVGWKPGIVGHETVKAEKGSSEGYAIQTGQSVTSDDIEHETRFKYADFIQDHGVKALINVLIIGPKGQRPYGLLQVDSRKVRGFTNSDIQFLRSYANLIAASIDRFRVLEEKQRADNIIRLSEEQLRISSQLNPQIPWTASPTGDVTDFDDRWLELTGLTHEQALRTGWQAVPHPDDLERMSQAWTGSIASGKPYDVQARLKTASGQFMWHRVRAFPWKDAKGEVLQWHGTVENIEERISLERALRDWNDTLEARVTQRTTELSESQRQRDSAEAKLRQSQKMEAVGQLTGGIAHDFNNMLAGIIASLELLQIRLKQERYAHIARYVLAAISSANKAAALTHRLLAFSRQQTLEKKLVQPNRLVMDMEEMIRRTVGPGITVETSLSADIGSIMNDPNQLENALLNLAINARDAMKTGGLLKIQTSDVRIEKPFAHEHDLSPGAYIKISVIDSGTGMPPEVAERAFDPFFTTKPQGEGTGLGLSMIYGFAKQSGGTVDIDTQPGKGTTVSVYLPRYQIASPGSAEVVKTVISIPHAEKDETVLLVEDDSVVRMMVRELLEELGYSVLEAIDSKSCLRFSEQFNQIDLLITDVGLPGGMNGFELAETIRGHRADLKVLFVTGFAKEAALGKEPLKPGMHIMSKPFSIDALGIRVREILNAAG